MALSEPPHIDRCAVDFTENAFCVEYTSLSGAKRVVRVVKSLPSSLGTIWKQEDNYSLIHTLVTILANECLTEPIAPVGFDQNRVPDANVSIFSRRKEQNEEIQSPTADFAIPAVYNPETQSEAAVSVAGSVAEPIIDIDTAVSTENRTESLGALQELLHAVETPSVATLDEVVRMRRESSGLTNATSASSFGLAQLLETEKLHQNQIPDTISSLNPITRESAELQKKTVPKKGDIKIVRVDNSSRPKVQMEGGANSVTEEARSDSDRFALRGPAQLPPVDHSMESCGEIISESPSPSSLSSMPSFGISALMDGPATSESAPRGHRRSILHCDSEMSNFGLEYLLENHDSSHLSVDMEQKSGSESQDEDDHIPRSLCASSNKSVSEITNDSRNDVPLPPHSASVSETPTPGAQNLTNITEGGANASIGVLEKNPHSTDSKRLSSRDQRRSLDWLLDGGEEENWLTGDDDILPIMTSSGDVEQSLATDESMERKSLRTPESDGTADWSWEDIDQLGEGMTGDLESKDCETEETTSYPESGEQNSHTTVVNTSHPNISGRRVGFSGTEVEVEAALEPPALSVIYEGDKGVASSSSSDISLASFSAYDHDSFDSISCASKGSVMKPAMVTETHPSAARETNDTELSDIIESSSCSLPSLEELADFSASSGSEDYKGEVSGALTHEEPDHAPPAEVSLRQMYQGRTGSGVPRLTPLPKIHRFMSNASEESLIPAVVGGSSESPGRLEPCQSPDRMSLS
ncbi:hypothetical protein BSKO_03432 [Bryopsis sp. KO-2023]|nr:hypothetical protein BSKO_03432 [Bryopsis sp. KO-2023]